MASPRLPHAELDAIASRMGEQLAYRGPDCAGVWVDEASGIALAHRRLAILDLSSEGAQPMRSETGRFVITFNGEIYNHLDLHDELSRLGHAFRGHSDTEVLLAAAEEWGVSGALERSNGMFALALWDRPERRLYLARDRMGEKPLYYGWVGDTFYFASELKAIRAHPRYVGEIDRGALAAYMRHGYVPGPRCIYAGLRKAIPGAFVTVSSQRRGEQLTTRFWSPCDVAARRAAEARFDGDADDAVNELDRLLREAVKLRMHADVPLGAFLSGGIDSSTVAALMQAQSTTPVRTFTIGFREDGYDEAMHAKKVAQHLGTDHTELYLTASDALNVIPRLPALYDEPFADSSQIPTFLLSQLARRSVTVSLSGDGGDELFCGYTRYGFADATWRALSWCPGTLRGLAGRAIQHIPPTIWSRQLGWVERALPRVLAAPNRAQNIETAIQLLQLPSREALYRRIISHWKDPDRLVLGGEEPPTILSTPSACPDLPSFADRMMFLDALTYLPDDILVKVDRASMGVSLEARVPLLDHRVVEFAWSLPIDLKLRDGVGKWVLRQVLSRYVPESMVDRPKMGFGVPIDSWLRGPLRDWALDLLSVDRLKREGFLDPTPVQAMMAEHLTGRRERQYYLWDVLMFEAWLEAQASNQDRWLAPAHRAWSDSTPHVPEV